MDCGSGGTRVWQRGAAGGSEAFVRVAWPVPPKAPVLCKALGSHEGMAAFARGIGLLGGPCFVGATAGLRHALETGELTPKHLEVLRSLLPPGCQLHVLTPLEEARYECLAMRRYCLPTDGMLSMGGKSMQIACGDALYSLPFAMHSGYDILHDRRGGWSERLARCTREYQRMVAVEQERQHFQLQGTFVCVTDIMVLADELGLADKVLLASEVVDVLVQRAQALLEARSDKELVHAARVCLLQALLSGLFGSCLISFRSDFKVSWPAGFFAELASAKM